MRRVTIQFGLQNRELPQTVSELRVLDFSARVFNRLVEPAEDLLERIVVALAVAARQVGVQARARQHQRGVFDHDLVLSLIHI